METLQGLQLQLQDEPVQVVLVEVEQGNHQQVRTYHQ